LTFRNSTAWRAAAARFSGRSTPEPTKAYEPLRRHQHQLTRRANHRRGA
jgi:hypothetical protein